MNVGRCTRCRRWVVKSDLQPGPSGGLYGPECVKYAVQAALTPDVPIHRTYQEETDTEVEDGGPGKDRRARD